MRRLLARQSRGPVGIAAASLLAMLTALCLAAGMIPLPAAAHHLASGSGRGVAIPSLMHGQMEIYARHWDEILALATRDPAPSAGFSRVLNFARIQKAWCLWGLAPGALRDEESPFNECSHAYLAAARSLLDDLRERAAPASDADSLAATIERELVEVGAQLVCGFSGEEFHTADHIVPAWSAIARHPPSLALLASASMAMLGLALACRRWTAKPA